MKGNRFGAAVRVQDPENPQDPEDCQFPLEFETPYRSSSSGDWRLRQFSKLSAWARLVTSLRSDLDTGSKSDVVTGLRPNFDTSLRSNLVTGLRSYLVR